MRRPTTVLPATSNDSAADEVALLAKVLVSDASGAGFELVDFPLGDGDLLLIESLALSQYFLLGLGDQIAGVIRGPRRKTQYAQETTRIAPKRSQLRISDTEFISPKLTVMICGGMKRDTTQFGSAA